MHKVHLKRGKAGAIAAGHPWVFSGAIDRVEGGGSADVVEVFSDRGDRLGLGLWSEQSAIRVRMVGEGDAFGADELAASIQRAQERRRTLGIPESTDAYRCVNSEGDHLGGLSVDVFGQQLVTFIASTRPMFDRREQIATALGALFPDAHVLERPAPPAIAKLEGFVGVEQWHTAPLEQPITVREFGVAHVIDPSAMQKTGHYADMRQHRQWVRAIAKGKSVLDAYSYTGGFGLQALAGGAREVTFVDSSSAAIDGAIANAAANGWTADAHAKDVGDFLRSAFDRKLRYDIIVLDPPKLAPRRKHVSKAMKVYESIAVQAARLLEPGGVLCIGSCSEAIGVPELNRVFGTVTQRVSRPTAVLHAGGQPVDHPYPAAMSEGAYLSFVAASLS